MDDKYLVVFSKKINQFQEISMIDAWIFELIKRVVIAWSTESKVLFGQDFDDVYNSFQNCNVSLHFFPSFFEKSWVQWLANTLLFLLFVLDVRFNGVTVVRRLFMSRKHFTTTSKIFKSGSKMSPMRRKRDTDHTKCCFDLPILSFYWKPSSWCHVSIFINSVIEVVFGKWKLHFLRSRLARMSADVSQLSLMWQKRELKLK